MVESVLVVGGGDDLRDDQLPIASTDYSTVTVVCVLVKDAVILFVDADSVGENGCVSSGSRHDGIKVFDRTLAIAPCRQRVRHQPHTVLANVKGVFAVMREIRVAVRDDHFRHAQAVENHPAALLIHVVDADI